MMVILAIAEVMLLVMAHFGHLSTRLQRPPGLRFFQFNGLSFLLLLLLSERLLRRP